MNDMIDMSRFTEAKSDQLNADDLIGVTKTITVTKVTGAEGDQPISIFYRGDNGKPFKPCKTMRRVLLAVWGRYANDYVGRSMTVYRDDKVTFGGLDVGGIRISHMSHIDKETIVVVAKSKGKKAGLKILPLAMPQTSDFTLDDAKAALEFATSMDELKTAWTKKTMAPFRDQLGSLLEQRKKALTDQPATGEGSADAADASNHSGEQAAPEQGRGVEDHGEAFTADDLISQIERIEGDADLVDAFLSLHADTIAAYSDDEQRRISGVANGQRITLQRAAAK